MDQEIVDILNKVPRCVTRKVIKINNSLDLNLASFPWSNHTRKVDNTMQNIQEMTREDWDREIKNNNVFSSQKNKDESDHDFLVRLLEEIEGLTNGFSFDDVEVKVLLENKDWEGLRKLILEASHNQDSLNITINDYYDFIDAKEKNKIIL
mgnify:CR=1 FL=1